MLRPGDRVEKLIERALVTRANQDKTDELVELAKVGGVIAGQVVALSLGADPKAVFEVAGLLMGGEDDGGER